MKTLTLKCGAVVKVDDADFERISKYTWFLSNKGYAVASTHVNGSIQNFYLHRVVLDAPKDIWTDHIDGDRLNNTRANLRLCTATQNNMNLAKRKGTTSRFKGVYWCKQKGKWHTRIKMFGKAKHLGFFSDEQAAAIAYDEAAINLFGQFARINNIGVNHAN